MSIKTHLNLTQSQLSMWASQKLHHNVPLHRVVHTFEISGAIDEKVFESAFQKLLNEVDILRTVFSELDGIPFQSFQDNVTFKLEKVDFTPEKNKSVVDTWVLERAKKTLDISKRVFDTVLLKIEEEKYTWFLNLHHLITDGFTTSMLYARMNSIYIGILNDDLEVSNKLSSFEEYLHFESEQQKSTSNDINRSFWKEKITGLDELPKLYGAVNKTKNTITERISVPLGKLISQQLRDLAKHSDIRGWTTDSTLFNIFSSIYFIYLNRISGQKKLAISAPTHNRTEKNFRRTAGLFMEVFPMVDELCEDDTFLSVSKRIKVVSNLFLKNAKPGILTPEMRRCSNVLLNYVMTSFTKFNGFSTKSHWIHTGHMSSTYQMQLHIVDFDQTGEIELVFDINTSILDTEKRKNLPSHFLKLMNDFLKDMNKSINESGLMSDAEIENNYMIESKSAYENLSISAQFENQVARTPKNIMVIHENNSLTYEVLNKRANQLANYLVEQNVGSGSRVAILLKRCPEYLISVLGVLKTGAAFMPIPSTYPQGRIQYLLKDGDVSLLIGSTDLFETLNLTEVDVFKIDIHILSLESYATLNLSIGISSDAPAYLIYTSGSTGDPKGVQISHKALGNHLSWASEFYHVTSDSFFPFFTSIGFDATLNAIFLPMLKGGKIIVYTEPNSELDDSLFRIINDNKCTFLKCTPSHLTVLQGLDLRGSRLRTLIVGGEELKSHLAKSMLVAFGKRITIFNQYGPTEAAIACIATEFDVDEHINTFVPIGHPIPNVEIYLLDGHRNLVPIGVIGEIYIGGIGIAKSYWKRPKLTGEKFIPHPFKPGYKIYRTGDIARLNEYGDFEFLGRTDFQVKLNGHRIELGEIEGQLVQFETIDSGIVMLVDRNGAKSLTAYFTAQSPIILPQLRSYLLRKLPQNMIPSRFKQLERFPLSPSGKVDRNLLKTLQSNSIDSIEEYVAPHTEIEELVTNIWQEVLEVSKIGVKDNFVALGGHSLAAIRVTSKINQAVEFNFPLNKIFELPTITEYSVYIEDTLTKLLNN